MYELNKALNNNFASIHDEHGLQKWFMYRQRDINRNPRTYVGRKRVFKAVAQTWDYNNPCPHCGCIYLKSTSKRERKICCQHGALIQNNNIMEELHPSVSKSYYRHDDERYISFHKKFGNI